MSVEDVLVPEASFRKLFTAFAINRLANSNTRDRRGRPKVATRSPPYPVDPAVPGVEQAQPGRRAADAGTNSSTTSRLLQRAGLAPSRCTAPGRGVRRTAAVDHVARDAALRAEHRGTRPTGQAPITTTGGLTPR